MMKKLSSLLVLFLLVSCDSSKKNVKTCWIKGMPLAHQGFVYMYFKNKEEGYLFGTYTRTEESTPEQSADPNFFPKSTDEANIYKTMDGGRNWVKIDSIMNKSYYKVAFILNDNIYITLHSSLEEGMYFVKFDTKTDKVVSEKYYPWGMAIMLHDENHILISTRKGTAKVFDENLKQLRESKLDFSNTCSLLKGKIYTIKNYRYFQSLNLDGSQENLVELPLGIGSDQIINLDENKLRPLHKKTQKNNVKYLIFSCINLIFV